MKRIADAFWMPVEGFRVMAADVAIGLERAIAGRARNLIAVLAGVLLGWWVYVPIHELLHALGCVVAGGRVTALQISPLYGGGLLARVLPFVVPGGEYAGRLSGFDTHGSDWTYLSTDLCPYVLTVFPGVWRLRRAKSAFSLGFWVPCALAPFVSLTGDAYEIGAIVTTWIPHWQAAAGILRGDDMVALARALAERGGAPWAGFAVASLVGFVWACVVYRVGDLVARALGASPTARCVRSDVGLRPAAR